VHLAPISRGLACFISGAVVGAASAARYLPELENPRCKNPRPSTSASDDDDARRSSLAGESGVERPRSALAAVGSLSFMAVAGHSTPSKPWLTLIVEVEARARHGEKSDAIQSPAVTPERCLPVRCDAKICWEMESHTANPPSAIPRASMPARDQRAKSGSNGFPLPLPLAKFKSVVVLYSMPDHICMPPSEPTCRRVERREMTRCADDAAEPRRTRTRLPEDDAVAT